MRLKELTDLLEIQKRHYVLKRQETPILDPGIYSILGRRLYDLYQKYDIQKEDQRVLESISYLLVSKNLDVDRPQQSLLKKLIHAWRR